jgi:Predicted oxidoreductases (related to aryl-alcohol dehydrogenases)
MLQMFREAGGTVIDIEADPAFPEPLETVATLMNSDDFVNEGLKISLRVGNFGGFGPTREQTLRAIREVLQYLPRGHVDLLTVHGPRQGVQLDETISALDTLYRSGAARYVSLGEFSWWDGGACVAMAEANGFKISGWSGELSLLRPSLASQPGNQVTDAGLGIVAGAPLALGLLTGKYRHNTPADSRGNTPRFRSAIRARMSDRTNSIVDAVSRAAEGFDKSAAQVSLAWVLGISGVATAVIGPRNEVQLSHLLEVADWHLPVAIHDALREVAMRRE